MNETHLERMTKISVIIPYYNGEQSHLQKAISSTLSQSIDDIEIIIVDDGSEISIKNYIEVSDSRIKFIQHDNNKGIPSARNTGILKSDGDFIAFLDQDDWFHDKRLELQLNEFQRTSDTELGIVFGDIVEFHRGDYSRRFSEDIPMNRNGRINYIFHNNPVVTVTTLIRRECFDDIGYLDETLYGADDWEFWLRAAHKYTFKHIPEIMSYKRVHSNNAASNVPAMTQDKLDIIDKYSRCYPCLTDVDRKRAGIRLQEALYYRNSGEPFKLMSSIISALIASPKYSTAKAIDYFYHENLLN